MNGANSMNRGWEGCSIIDFFSLPTRALRRAGKKKTRKKKPGNVTMVFTTYDATRKLGESIYLYMYVCKEKKKNKIKAANGLGKGIFLSLSLSLSKLTEWQCMHTRFLRRSRGRAVLFVFGFHLMPGGAGGGFRIGIGKRRFGDLEEYFLLPAFRSEKPGSAHISG